jgi:hypothetical protein
MSSTPIKLLSGTTGIVWRLVGFGSGISRMGIGTSDAVDFTMLGTVDVTPALNLTWAASGGTGTWDTSPSNQVWTNNSGGASSPFTNGDNVTFSGSGGVVTVSGTVSPGTLAVTNASGTYQFTGGSVRATAAATKSGAGTLVLTQDNGTNLSRFQLGVAAGGVELVGQRLVFAHLQHGLRQTRHHLLRQAGRADQAVPGVGVKTLQAQFVHGGHLGKRRRTLEGCDGDRPHLAALGRAHHRAQRGKQHRHLPAHQVRHGRAAPLVGNVQDRGASDTLEVFA